MARALASFLMSVLLIEVQLGKNVAAYVLKDGSSHKLYQKENECEAVCSRHRAHCNAACLEQLTQQTVSLESCCIQRSLISVDGAGLLFADWKNGTSIFRPGAEATLQITPLYGIEGQMVRESPFETSLTAADGEREIVQSNLTYADNYHLLAFRVPKSAGRYVFNVVTTDGVSLPGSPFEFSVLEGDVSVTSCVGTWVDGSSFDVGENASLSVQLANADNDPITGLVFSFTVTVDGQSDAVSDISMDIDGPLEIISFTTRKIGQYMLNVGFGSEKISGSPFAFRITAGNVSATACIASWVNGVNSFRAGALAGAKVLLRDAFNNTVNFGNGKTAKVEFALSIYGIKTDTRTIPDPEFNIVPDFQTGYEFVYFVAKLAGHFFLSIASDFGDVIGSPLEFDVTPGNIYVPACIGQFASQPTFQAGSKAAVIVKLSDEYGSTLWTGTYDFTVSVEGKLGASRYVSDVNTTQTQPGYMIVSFTPTAAGNFLLQVGDGMKSIKNSPLAYTVTGGPIHVPFCTAEWLHDIDSFVAGEQAAVRVLLMDAFNNNVSDATGRSGSFFKFTVNVISPSGGNTTPKNLRLVPDEYESGYVLITFNVFAAGINTLEIGNGTDAIFNSPLTFTVLPGPVSVPDCFLEWPYGATDVQIDNLVNLIINKRDIYGNPVPDDFPFIVELFSVSTGDSYPLGDLKMMTLEPRSSGKILAAFTANSGSFQIKVSDGNTSVKGSPANYSTFVGIVDPTRGNCSGDGFTTAIVGQAASFDIQLEDSTGDTAYEIGANTSSRRTVRAFLSLGDFNVEASVTPDSTMDGLYHVGYSTSKAGVYNITVTWTYNVICQGTVTVAPGSVVISKSSLGGEGILPVISKNVMQQIYILLVDSLGNAVQGQRDRISWSVNGPGNFQAQDLLDIGTGYSTAYTIFDSGQFTITISYDKTLLPGNPVKITVMPEAYFPKAVDDTVWTWEEVSISIDVLANDFVSAGTKNLAGFYKIPSYGSALVEDKKIRYTPRQGYSGNDVLIYLISDSKNQIAYGFVFVAIRTEPPDFTFWPKALAAIEGQPVSTLDDFSGFYVSYTNRTEILTLQIRAEHGHVYLPADALQLWHDVGFQNASAYSISLSGTVDFINKALQAFLYIGETFYNGNDTLVVSVMNQNNTGDVISIPVEVRPFNNPPFILAPTYVLKDKSGALKALAGDTVAFKVKNPIVGITVGDPDAADVRADGRIHQLEVTLETSDGSIKISLPQSAAGSAEYRPENGYLWQPSLGATISSGFFTLEAQALRFRGTVAECNIALSTIRYNGTKDGEALTIVVNDMGNFGCYSDCFSDFSIPLIAQAMIIVFTEIPRSSWWAYRKRAHLRKNTVKQAKIFGSTVASVGIAGICLLCFLCLLGKRLSRNRQRAVLKDLEEIKDDEACDATRIYNPLWIPPAVGQNRELLSTPNPLIMQQRQQELRQRIRDVEMEMETFKKASIPPPNLNPAELQKGSRARRRDVLDGAMKLLLRHTTRDSGPLSSCARRIRLSFDSSGFMEGMEHSSRTWSLIACLLVIGALFPNCVHGFGYMNTISTLWGGNPSRQSYSVCNIEAVTRRPHCWGTFSINNSTKPPANVSLWSLTGGAYFSCGLLEGSHTPVCWGQTPGSAVPPAFANISYSSINCGGWHACAIRTNSSNPEDNGKVDCWGNNNFGQASPPTTVPMESVTAGDYFTCGLTQYTKRAVCWGLVSIANSSVHYHQQLPLESISAGRTHICGITRNTQEPLCWGANDHGQSTPPMNVTFSAITAGMYHTCGLRLDNHEALCWGDNSLGQCNVPDGVGFSVITSGDRYTCGVRIDSMAIECWGNQVTAPKLSSSQGLCVESCKANQFELSSTGQCPDGKICMPCARCGDGSYEASACAPTRDTKCSGCSSCSFRKRDTCSSLCARTPEGPPTTDTVSPPGLDHPRSSVFVSCASFWTVVEICLVILLIID